MSYTDLRDFDPELKYVDEIYGLTFQIEKLGGGTLGKSYTGIWRYMITKTETGELYDKGQDWDTPVLSTHEDVMSCLVDEVRIKIDMESMGDVPDDD